MLRPIPVCGGMLSVIYNCLHYGLRNMIIWVNWLLYKIICGLPVCVYLHCTCRYGVWICTVVSVLWQLCEFVEWVGFVYLLFCDKSVLLVVCLNV